MPARAGELIRAIFLGKKESISKTSVLGTIVIERILDGLVLVGIMVLSSLILKPNSDQDVVLKALIVTGCMLFGIATAFVVIGAKNRNGMETLLRLLFRQIPDRFYIKVMPIIMKLLDSLTFLNAYNNLIIVLSLSLLIWLIEGLVFWVGLIAFQLPPHMLIAYFTLTLVNLWMILPAAPGGVGVFQGAAVFAFSFFDISSERALSYSIVIHAVMIISSSLIGLVIINRNRNSVTNINADL